MNAYIVFIVTTVVVAMERVLRKQKEFPKGAL